MIEQLSNNLQTLEEQRTALERVEDLLSTNWITDPEGRDIAYTIGE